MDFTELNDRETGRTVFIVGAGPQLATLPADQVAALGERPTIGGNLTQYKVRLRYFLSAHIGHVILAWHRLPDATILHMRERYEDPLLDFILPLKRVTFEPGMRLPRRLAPPEPTLLTRFNFALGASNLALILGARCVVFVGVEQRNARHFYSVDKEVAREIVADLPILERYRHIRRDHRSREEENVLHLIGAGDRTLAAQPFFRIDHTPSFKAFFDDLKTHGIEIFSTTADSVVVDAGGTFLPLKDALALEV